MTTTTTTTTNGFRDPDDAIPDIEYVLELPAGRASALCGELTRAGVPADRIKVIEPGDGGVPSRIPSATIAVVESSRGQRTGPGKKKSHANGCGGDDDGGGGRRQQRVARFLPRSIKLGTYSGGQYNVSIRRRTVPDGREFVWISAAAAAATDRTAAAAAADRTAAAERNDGLPTVMLRCRCAGAACDDYRNALREYLEVDGGGGVECVYRRFADALPKTNVDHGNGADDGVSDRVKPPPAVTSSVDKTTDDNQDGNNGETSTDHAGRLTGGGGEPTSEPDVGDGRKITDDTAASLQVSRETVVVGRATFDGAEPVFLPVCQQSSEARFFDDDDDSLTDRSGDHRSTTTATTTTTTTTATTATATATVTMVEPSRTDVVERETVEQRARPAVTGPKRTKKSLFDRLPWRATNRSRNGGGRHRPTDDDDAVKAAANNKAR